MHMSHRADFRVLALSACLVLTACGPRGAQPLEATATEHWTKTYPLSAGGEVQIVGGRGSIEVTGGPGDTVEVRAARIARAATDATARDVAPRIEIREDVTPEKIVIQTKGLSGIVIGVEVQVDYHVTVPEGARVRLRTSNGSVTVTGVNGRVAMTNTNGPITASRLGGGVEARGTNQKVSVDLAAFGADPVEVRAINAPASVTLPAEVNATLTATSVNGRIDLGPLNLSPIGEQTPRRARGQLGAGGAPIEVHAVNGSVTIGPRP
jgi:DUF4097 and DUF4098 domain-containing protein YvlB